jgi:hypothetical protein
MRQNAEKHLAAHGGRDVRARLRAARAAASNVEPHPDRGAGETLARPGFCDPCNRGVVSGRFFAGRPRYDQARAALSALRSCPDYNCEMCSIALLTDADCPCCNRRFRNGFFTPIRPPR